MSKVIAVILGGGRGERLRPLTSARAKPAVPIAGMFRLVDVPISNCLNAEIHHIFVLTQYLSASLNRHVGQTYRFDAFRAGQVQVLAAEQVDQAEGWYQGTADAVRKQLQRYEHDAEDDILILSGDQLYMMDLGDFVQHHRKMGADVTIAATRCRRDEARRFGIMRIDADTTITEFAEKPKDDAVLDAFTVPDPEGDKTHLASMGIYCFRASVLEELLGKDTRDDFGKHILPTALQTKKLAAYPYSGFWEDVGTIESYHRVNLTLTDPVPKLDLFDEKKRLFSRPRFLPPAKVGEALVQRALMCDGAVIGDGATVRKSIVGIRGVIGPGCNLDRVVYNGAGAFDFQDMNRREKIPLGIGEYSVIRNAIIDRDTRIGRGVRLVNDRQVAEYQDEHISVRDGIIVVPRRGTIPDGYTF
ncbi:MAG: NTP transferase domain-containing protein [Deltaproteobacteria bacterium]|nr:NTP transferase domain-containing protein [Deltaproteobacteria bacterium]